jgi:O-antigen ligase
MSPQLHTWVYGYFPHSFLQQIREGGYRPVVFLGHGLLVAFFTMTTAVAAAALWRTQTRIQRLSAGAVTAYLSGMLVLCKTAGALVYGTFLIPLARFAGPRTQLRIALLLVSLALLYPTLRAENLVPTETMLSLAASVSAERAQSLQTRFEQEKQLLDHTSERPLLGWGRWGRNRIADPETGDDVSITDGLWILTMGEFGYV